MRRSAMRRGRCRSGAIMPGRVIFDRGAQMAGIIKDESRHDSSRDYAGGYEMEALGGAKGSVGMAGGIGQRKDQSAGSGPRAAQTACSARPAAPTSWVAGLVVT